MLQFNDKIASIDSHLDEAFRRGKSAMYAYFSREVGSGRCPVCIATRLLRMSKTIEGSYVRGKRVVCMAVLRAQSHTCGKKGEMKNG